LLKKLRIKFVAIMMTVVTVMLAVIFGLILHFTQLNYTKSSIEFMGSVTMEPRRPDRPDVPRQSSPFAYFMLWRNEEGDLFHTGDEDVFDLSDRKLLDELIRISENGEKPSGFIKKYNLRYLKVINPAGKSHTVFMDVSAERAAMASLVKTSALSCTISFVLFLGISIFLARVTVKPVERAWNQQRQFVADASHELKTPLTVITTNAELITAAGNEEDRLRCGENILQVAKQMRGLVEGMLELARADNGSLRMNWKTVDFSETLNSIILLFEPLCYENSLTLENKVEANVLLRGSEEYLGQVPEILLDNALKYSEPGTTVRVSLEKQAGSCLLTVENRGETISGEDLKNIFKRFYRGDKARSGSKGYGLGLAIAEDIVKQHKGKIWCESRDGVNRFMVRLPM